MAIIINVCDTKIRSTQKYIMQDLGYSMAAMGQQQKVSFLGWARQHRFHSSSSLWSPPNYPPLDCFFMPNEQRFGRAAPTTQSSAVPRQKAL